MMGVMALFDSELREELFLLMKMGGVINYTHFKGLHGSGNQGRKEGSVTWPGTNEIIMMLMQQNEWENFKDLVKEYKINKGTKTGLLVFQWPLDEVVI